MYSIKIVKIFTVLCVLAVFIFFTQFHTLLFAAGIDKEALERELTEIEKQIQEYEGKISETRQEKHSLSNSIRLLNNEEAKLRLEMQASAIKITELDSVITETKSDMQEIRDDVDALKGQLATILRALNRQSASPLVALFTADNGFSSFFDEIKDLERLTGSVADKVAELKIQKELLEEYTARLERQVDETKNLFSVQVLQQDSIDAKTAEKKGLLAETEGREDAFKEALAEREQRAREIRSQVYELLGVSKQITFGEAVEVATWASRQTGVRVAFLLAVLKQESNLGHNVGTCNRIGDPPEKGWRAIMKPERDQEPFLAITKELGLDPDITPVSCPMRDRSGNRIGWGGAMGPAQFIPSTWMGYKNRLASIIGKMPNPWDIRDAFLASALLLKDNGAATEGEDGEWRAAMRYFSGSTNPRFRFYGDRVLELARGFEDDIKLIQ